MRKIRRGDEVQVISGKHRGSRGKVRINMISEEKVVIEGVNIVIKHVKRGRARQAGRIEVEAPMHLSKVMLICPSCDKPSRIGVRENGDARERFCKKCDATVPRPKED